MGGVVTEPISMEQIRRARAFADATYYPDGNLPAPRVPEACTAERPFGPCTKRCEQPAGHDGPHRSQCFAWCNPHDIATDIANLWSGPKDLWNTADGGQIIGQMVTRYCRLCPWMEEHMCAFGEDGDCDHTEGWTEK
jgi:hypothetical protein